MQTKMLRSEAYIFQNSLLTTHMCVNSLKAYYAIISRGDSLSSILVYADFLADLHFDHEY